MTAPTMSNPRLDATDGRILRLLVKNARASYREIGTQVGLSANAVTQRMRRMEAAGVIRGYTTQLDPVLEGPALQAVVHATTTVDADAVVIEEGLAAIPVVSEVLELAGTIDYEIRLRARTQAELYDALQVIRALPGITGLETRTVLRPVLRR